MAAPELADGVIGWRQPCAAGPGLRQRPRGKTSSPAAMPRQACHKAIWKSIDSLHDGCSLPAVCRHDPVRRIAATLHLCHPFPAACASGENSGQEPDHEAVDHRGRAQDGRIPAPGLQEAGFAVELANHGSDGLHLASEGDHDLLILDVMPGLDGWQVLRQLRAQGARCRCCC